MNKNVKKVFIILLIVIVLLLICVKCYLSFVEVKNGSNLGIQNNPIREDQDEKKSKDNLKDNDKVLDEDDKQKEQEISNEEGIKDDTSEKVQNIKQENSKSDNKKKVKKNTGKPSTKETKNNIESDTSKKEENGKSQENTSQKEEKPKKEENSNVGNKKEDITSNQNNGTNSSESPFVTENDRLRKNIKAKYGVSVGYKDEIDDNYINSYEKQYDDQKINKILNTIDVALGKYPNSFFYEISNRWKSLTIYLVKNINSSMSGLTDNRNVNKVIILISTEGYLFENTLHHEIMHYIDCYLATIIGASELEHSMNNYNPSGFVYGNQTNEYVYYYSNPAYFLSAYSKSNYKEDRAVLFSDMMSRSLKKDYYSLGNPINEKAKVISNQLEKYFNCVSNSTNEYWSRFIEW